MYNDYDPIYEDIAEATAFTTEYAAVMAEARAVAAGVIAAGKETIDVPRPTPIAGPPLPTKYIPPPPADPGVETEDLTFNGEGELIAMPTAVTAVPTAFPVPAVIAGLMSLGFFKALLAKFGPVILKLMVGAAAFAGFMKLLSGGASDEIQLPIHPGEGKKKRRYSIGHNPRVRTLQKVSRHCMTMLKKHRKVIDEFLPPKRQALPASALARTYLSKAERKALAQ